VNDVVIRAENLNKVYRLYAKPTYRFRDMFGWLGDKPGAFTEHAALDGIDLEIRRGEKVAVIGRNGAGKSTLLKLITRVIEPTAGRVDVQGALHALLQIGTGFHPDFTGRENVIAYLAQLGITGPESERMCAAAVEFAELEEYIGQPVKTYSTGMALRLMFAASTVLLPDILVLDEVLGVGDAYFAQKSFERIHELCDGSGTTLLLVTHDVYSAMKLCTRFIWLDRGRILMDGTSRDVVQAYELSIREQEEHRLRLKRMAAAARETADGAPPLFGQVQRRGQDPPAGRVAVAEMRIVSGSAELARLSMAAQTPGDGLALELKPGDGNWSDVVEFQGRTARCFLPHGSIFHRLPFLVANHQAARAIREGGARLELTMWSDPGASDGLEVAVSDPDGRRLYGGPFDGGSGPGWRVLGAALEKGATGVAASRREGVVRYGSRALEIGNVRFCDAAGRETLQFAVGSTLRVAFDYRLNDPDFDELPTVIMAFQKDGTTRSHRFWTDRIAFRAARRREGTIEVLANPLLLGAGTYTVTVSVYREGYFDSRARHRFFAANPEVLDKHSRGYEIVVRPSTRTLCNDVVFQHASEWYVNGQRVAETAIVREG
jgi:ABC-type polysaccharide/polyol phosphate transport system ATPase subunit